MTARSLIARLLLATVLLAPSFAWAQSPLLQGGQWSSGHVPAYSQSGGSQPIVQDGGAAGGGGPGVGLSELNVTARCTTPPCASSGTGQSSAHVQLQDAPTTSATGYHFLALDANSGGGGLVSYGAAGGAAALPLNFIVNGTTYSFPFTTGGTIGPGLSVVGHAACWNNLVGTLLSDCGVPAVVAGAPGQIQYNSAGSLGAFTVGGDGTLNTGTGALAITKLGGVAATLGGALSTGGALTTSNAFTTAGAFPITLTAAGATTVTLPQSGTLATLAGSEALTNKTVNGLTVTPSTGTLSITNGKTAAVTNTLTIAGTDGSTLNVAGGGTLGSAAFTSASAYAPSTAPFQTTRYTSSDAAYTNGSTLTFAHGLGSANLLVLIQLVCQSNDQGYTAGQILLRQPGEDQANLGVTATVDATNVVLNVGSSGMGVVNPSGGYNTGALDPTKWKVRVTVFKYQ